MGRIINTASAVVAAALSLSATAQQGGGDAAERGGEVRVTVTSGPTDCDPYDRVSEGRFLVMHYSGSIVDVPSSSSSSVGESASDIGRIFESTREPSSDVILDVTAGEDGDVDVDVEDGDPVAFRIGTGAMIPGWEKGLLGLCNGVNATLVVPPHLAYGDSGLQGSGGGPGDDAEGGGGGVPPGATLKYDVEILSVSDDPPSPMDYDGEGGGGGEEEDSLFEEPNVFVELDRDGDGKLNDEEVTAFFKSMGMDGTPPELWENEDRDKDGFISWEEFGGPKGWSPPPPAGGGTGRTENHHRDGRPVAGEDETNYGEKMGDDFVEEGDEGPPTREEFDAVDSDGDGRLSLEEVTEYFAENDIEGEPSHVLAEQDDDNDGYIDPEEFGLPPPHDPLDDEDDFAPDGGMPPFDGEDGEMELNPRKIFEDVDANGDGRLDKDEVEDFFAGLGGTPEEYWDEEDVNGDSYITLNEFMGGADSGFDQIDAEEAEELFGDKEGTDQAVQKDEL